MIRSFSDTEAERLFNDQRSRRLPGDIQRRARRKLLMLNQSSNVNDLRTPPGNRLEQLHGHRQGQYSIRINQQCASVFALMMVMPTM